MNNDSLGKNPFMGVDPRRFSMEIEQQWIGFGNTPSPALKHNWYQMAKTLNRHLQNAGTMQGAMTYRFPLETGAGKSTSLPRYLAMLGGIAGTRDRCPGVIITTQYTVECDRIAEEINRMGSEYGMKEPMAIALHSGVNRSKLKSTKLHSWPFIVMTQAAMTIALVEEGLSDLKGFRRLPWLMRYANGENEETLVHRWDSVVAGLMGVGQQPRRHMVIMDEMLMPFKSHNLTTEGVTKLMNSIPEELRLKHRDAMSTISQLLGLIELNSCMTFDEEGWLKTADLGDWPKRAASVVPLIQDLRDGHAGTGFGEYFKTLEGLVAIHSIKGGGVALKTKGTIQSLFKSDFILDRLGMGCVILDGTTEETKLLDVYAEQTTALLRKCRNYQNLTIELDWTSGTGRKALTGAWKSDQDKDETVNATVNRIVDILLKVDPKKYPKVGLISFKPIIEALQTKGLTFPCEVILGYHGNVIGKNLWSDVDLLYVIGLNHMEVSYGEEILLGVKEYQNSIARTEDFSGDTVAAFGWSAEEVQMFELLRDTIQVIARASNRRAIDKDGNCRKSVVRITLGKGKQKDILVKGLKEHFHNVEIVEDVWAFDPGGGALGSDLPERLKEWRQEAYKLGNNHCEAALHWFNLTGWDDVSMYRICMELGLNKPYPTRFKEAFSNGRYRAMMDDLGIGYSDHVISGKHPKGVPGLVKA